MNIRLLISSLAVVTLFAGCTTTREISYFQDVEQRQVNVPVNVTHIRLRPEDKVAIIVNTTNDRLTNLFNLPYISQRLGSVSQTVTSNYSQAISGYTVSTEGNIEFPVLGTLHVEGFTRAQLAEYIKQQLIDNDLVKDPVVTVEFMNLTLAVLGEVSKPGRYSIEKDKITVLEALGMAGDLTIYGKRDNVKVMRIVDGVQKSYTLDLTSARDVVASPAYYVQQDDIIYVEPNEVRARQSTVNGNNIRSTSFWLSLATLAASVTTIVLNSLK